MRQLFIAITEFQQRKFSILIWNNYIYWTFHLPSRKKRGLASVTPWIFLPLLKPTKNHNSSEFYSWSILILFLKNFSIFPNSRRHNPQPLLAYRGKFLSIGVSHHFYIYKISLKEYFFYINSSKSLLPLSDLSQEGEIVAYNVRRKQ